MHQPFLKKHNKNSVLLLLIELCLLSVFGLLSPALNPAVGEAPTLSAPGTASQSIQPEIESDDPVSTEHLYFKGLPAGAREVLEERTHSSKTFLRPDGREQIIISSGDLHYNDNGSWKDVDTRWQPYSSKGNLAQPETELWDYQMVDAVYQAYVRKEFGKHEVVALSKQGHVLRMTPGTLSVQEPSAPVVVISAPRSVTGDVLNKPFDVISGGGHIEWKGAYGEGLDFRYTPSDTRFIKILEASGPDKLRTDACEETQPCVLQLDLDFTTDLDLYMDGRKWDQQKALMSAHVEFKGRDGQTQWWWKDPTATDASGHAVPGRFFIRPASAAPGQSADSPSAVYGFGAVPVSLVPRGGLSGAHRPRYVLRGFGGRVDSREQRNICDGPQHVFQHLCRW